MTPTITDDDKGTVTATIYAVPVRTWDYSTAMGRRRAMLSAREYAEGWHDCADHLKPVLKAAVAAITPPVSQKERTALAMATVALELNNQGDST